MRGHAAPLRIRRTCRVASGRTRRFATLRAAVDPYAEICGLSRFSASPMDAFSMPVAGDRRVSGFQRPHVSTAALFCRRIAGTLPFLSLYRNI